ncbi:MAG: translation initiation factor IF-3 [Bacteroidia bacterium]|nr:translation initiation factor IF-3 [Bacteroidia bacterium]
MAHFKGKRRYSRFPQKKVRLHRLNEEITAPEVRINAVGEIEAGIYPTTQVIAWAKEMGVDLVEIVAKAQPPVCRLIEYQKFLYEKKKKDKEQKAKTVKQVLKEIRFGPNTDEHDFNFKLNHAKKFLEEGAKIKAYVHFKGRSIAYKEKGEVILLRFASELEEFGKVEMLPKLEGNRMFLYMAPLSMKKKKKKTTSAPTVKEKKEKREKEKETEAKSEVENEESTDK